MSGSAVCNIISPHRDDSAIETERRQHTYRSSYTLLSNDASTIIGASLSEPHQMLQRFQINAFQHGRTYRYSHHSMPYKNSEVNRT